MEKELINKITNRGIMPYDLLDDCWVIITNDGIFAPPQGRMFHVSKDQAWKHWYNEMCWASYREYKKDYVEKNTSGITSVDYWSVQTDKNRRQIWEDFKESIVEECGFKIIQWKDAKRDVCGKIGAEGND